jgi:uncharacterized protein (UPF0262 family)
VPDQRLIKIEIDPASLTPAGPEIEHDRKLAIYDLLEGNVFKPAGSEGGPYTLRVAYEESRLVLDVAGPGFQKRHLLSLTPLKDVLKDYLLVCESYYEAVRDSTPAQIEAIDMGRRGLHDEGSRVLRERLDGKIELDHETARRLFTLICALHRRA